MKLLRLLFLSCILITSSAFVPQPAHERKAQDALPQSHDEIWGLLAKCKLTFDSKTGLYHIAFTPEAKAMAGKPITVSGFMLPLEAKEQFNHYLLSKRTPTCPYCPPGEPNEIIEVFSKDPVKWDEGMVVITGAMTLTDDPETGLFFHINDAKSVDITPFEMPHMAPVD